MVTYRELLGFVWQFMRRQRGIFLVILFIDSFTWSLDALLWPYILHIVIDIFTKFDGDRAAAWEALKVPILCGVGLTLYVEIMSRTMGYLIGKAIPKLQADMRMAMFDHVQHHSPHYFNERFAGSLANKVTDMTTQVEATLMQLFWPVIPALATCILGAFVLWFISPLFATVLIGWLFIHLGICLKFTKRCDEMEHRHGEARSTLIGRMVDSFTNNFAVNLFYRFKNERDKLSSFQKEEEKTNINAKLYVEKMRRCLSVFYTVVIIIGMDGSLVYFWLHDKITTGTVIQVFTSMWNITMIMWSVGTALPALYQSMGMIRQAYSVMRDPQDLGDNPGAQDLKVSSGAISFENVSFQYGENKLFQNKHAKINGGERIGLVGYTGAGKSTFISLILRLFPLKEGKILIDGQDIAGITLESLRRQVALIPQDPVLFHRTLRENIQFGKPEATQDEIVRAAQLAHCDEFIMNIPKGYDAVVGERGTKLSGGEKQRIAIARAILADAPILILDEATSALDSVTERCIQDSLETLMQGRTTLVIAHRLSTLSRMDRLFIFDKGIIVEEGAHRDLLAKNGLYTHLWNMQAGGFLPDNPSSCLN